MRKIESNPRTEARKYLDRAISRHRKWGDDERIPKALYDKALSRTAQTYKEFERLGRKDNGG